MISSELPEILGMSDRIAVMHGGTIVGDTRPRRGDAGGDPGAGARASGGRSGDAIMIGGYRRELSVAAAYSCCSCSWRWLAPRFFLPEPLRRWW